jgi:uncharacterized repeat protein (TIGR01451 family)
MDANLDTNKRLNLRNSSVVVLVVVLFVVLSASIVLSSPHYIPIDGWSPTTPLPQGLANRNAVVWGDHVYFVAGKSASDAPVGTIYAVSILQDGSLGSWTVAGELPVAVYLHATAASATDLYVIGGWDGARTRAEVWRAPFVPGGGLGAFSQLTTYPIALDLHQAVVVQNRLYVLGGWTGRDPLDQVYFAEILPNGLGPWQATTTMPATLYRLSAVAHNNRIYVSGGFDNRNAQESVYVANVGPDGHLGAWQTTTALPNPTFYHESVIHDGRLLVLGGRDALNEFSAVFAAPINPDGGLGAWTAQPALPESLNRFSAVSVTRNNSDFVYVMGGLHGASYRANVYHSGYPQPPTPTPTLTPTPEPVALVDIDLYHEPQRWVAPGEEIAYSFAYHNRSATPLQGAEIVNLVPAQVELLPESIQASASGLYTYTGTHGGATIRWQLGDVPPGGAGVVSYRVRRPLPTPPAIPRVLAIGVAGPTSAAPGAAIRYSVVITNNTAFPLTGLTVAAALPTGATYLSGGNGISGENRIVWTVDELAGDTVMELPFEVSARQTLVLYDYYAISDEGPTAKGQRLLVTQIGATDPPPPGDGTLIVNTGALLTWQNNGQTLSDQSNQAFNPNHALLLPLVNQQ